MTVKKKKKSMHLFSSNKQISQLSHILFGIKKDIRKNTFKNLKMVEIIFIYL